MKYEISVRPVTRYIVTEYHESEDGRLAGCRELCGETNLAQANEIARMYAHVMPAATVNLIVPEGHASDCSLHNGPAFPPAACDCGHDQVMLPKS